QDSLQLRRQLQVRGRVQHQDARVYEAGLALELVAAQAGDQAARGLQEDPGLGEGDPGAAPEAEGPAREVRVVVDRVEALGLAVPRVVVPGGEEAGELEARPVLVDRELGRRELGGDIALPALERVVFVLP